MKILMLLFNLFYLDFCLSINTSENEIKMIVDVIKFYKKPTAVIANVCWTSSEKLYLTKKLCNTNNNRNPVRFLNDNGQQEYTLDEHTILIFDIECPNAEHFLIKANHTKKFANFNRWLILGNSLNENDILPSGLYNLDILFDSEVIVSESNNQDAYTLSSIYKPSVNGKWKKEIFGIWTPRSGLHHLLPMNISIAMRRKNLEKAPIINTLVVTDNKTREDVYDLRESYSYSYFKGESERMIDLATDESGLPMKREIWERELPITMIGLMYMLVESCSTYKNIDVDTITKTGFRQSDPLYDFLNATRVTIYTDTWGYFVNGSWNGMIGDLLKNKADFAGTFIFITKQRAEVLSYLSSPSSVTIKFVFREPPLSYQNNLFLLPFRTTVWFCIAGFIIMLIIILYINSLWELKKIQSHNQESLNNTNLTPHISDIIILIISAVTQQGSSFELKGTLGRAIIFELFLTFLFLYTSYSASIVALLQSSSNEIRTLSDLYNSNLELGAEDIPYNRAILQSATEPLKKALYETKISPRGSKSHFYTMEEGIKKMQKGFFAFHMNIGTGYKEVGRVFHEHEKCGLQEIAFMQDAVPFFVCRQDSPYKEIYKIGLFRNHEHGLDSRISRIMFSKKPVCSVRSGSFGSVNMVDFYPALMMLLYGMILAFALLLLEILLHRRQGFGGTGHRRH